MSQAWRKQPWDPDVHSLAWQPLALVPGIWVVIQGCKPWPSGSLVCIEKQQPRNKAPLWWESALDQEPKDLGFPSVVSQSNVTQQTIQSSCCQRNPSTHSWTYCSVNHRNPILFPVHSWDLLSCGLWVRPLLSIHLSTFVGANLDLKPHSFLSSH